MKSYKNLLSKILTEGVIRGDRTGTGTRSLFGEQLKFDLSDGFPLLTTKRVHLKSVIVELLWILSGSTNVTPLKNSGVRIWNEWADENGDLGPVYGKQWRSWGEIDQIKNLMAELKSNPNSRRHVVSAWNVSDLGSMALSPCHCLFQFYIAEGKLSCQLYQRSADYFLGVPFNIASYSLLTMMIAQQLELQPGRFIHTFGDVHLYNNHEAQAKLQLGRSPGQLPKMIIKKAKDIFSYSLSDFRLEGYNPQSRIKAKVSV